MNRRKFIKLTGKSVLIASVGPAVLVACHTEEDMIGKPNWIVEGNFDSPLKVPITVSGNSSLIAQPASSTLVKGFTSNTLGYGTGMLGPTIVAQAGSTVSVDLQNKLSESTNIHWHGLVVPAAMDGHPEDLALPGASFQYDFFIAQRAGTYWYHPHPHEATAKQVFMGLAGLFLVRDEEEETLNLPSGDFEIPLIIQDKRFSGSSLVYAPSTEEFMTGYLGETIVVNGVHAPFLSVQTKWYRFRILNGSTARVYHFGFSNQQSFYLIGTDGGLLGKPEQISSFMLAPGERADILVNFKSSTVGGEIFLQSFKFSQYNVQGRQGFNIMKFSVEAASNDPFILPSFLSKIPILVSSGSTQVRTLIISSLVGGSGGHSGGGRHGINGKTYKDEHIEFTVQAGATEIWEFDNLEGEEIHPMHIHGVQFQVLARQGGRNQVFPIEKGWKDTVMVMAGEKVSVIMTFPVYRGRFVFHCHNLEHEDDGMMLNYEIV